MSDDLKRFNVALLKNYLETRGLPTHGVKKELLDRAEAVQMSESFAARARQNSIAQVGEESENDVAVTGAPPSSQYDAENARLTTAAATSTVHTTCAADGMSDVTMTSGTQRSTSGAIYTTCATSYEFPRADADTDRWYSKRDEDDDAHVNRARAEDERRRLKREMHDLAVKESKLQIEEEDREWRNYMELQERTRDLRVDSERRARAEREDLLFQRSELQERFQMAGLAVPQQYRDESGADERLSPYREAGAQRSQVPLNSRQSSEYNSQQDVTRRNVGSATNTVDTRGRPVASAHIGANAVPTSMSAGMRHLGARPRDQMAVSTSQDARNVRFERESKRMTSPVRNTIKYDQWENESAGYAQDRNDIDYDNELNESMCQNYGVSSANTQRSEADTYRCERQGRVDVPQTTSRPMNAATAPTQHNQTVVGGNDRSFKQLIDMMNLPKQSLMSFGGDPMQYHMFVSSFNTCIDAADVNDASKLNRLFELCEGKARTVINPCALMEPSQGYRRAKRLLKQRFGDDYVIAEAWVAKITNGPAIKHNSIESLQDFTDDVRACVETLRSMNRLQEVDTRSRLVTLMRRLPENLQSRWRRKAVYVRDETDEYPNIEVFLRFLDGVSREANDPVFGIVAEAETREFGGKNKQRFKHGKSMAVETTTKSEEKGYNAGQKEVDKCPLCTKDHPLYACADFKKLPARKRVEVAKEKRLCFSCLKPAKHVIRFCQIDKICGIDGCTYKHSRFLHAGFAEAATARAPRQAESTPSTATAADTNANGSSSVSARTSVSMTATKQFGRTALPVVGVTVTSSNGRSANVYALLDTGSDRTFCATTLLDDLGIKGKPTQFTISTLNKGKELQAQEVSLSVKPLHNGHGGMCWDVLHLPEVFAIDGFPALTNSVATAADLSNYSHLKGIPLPDVDAKSVKLLIGQDNPDALVPLESRRGERNQPFAVRTPLGWTINGPLDAGNRDKTGISNFLQYESSLYDNDTEPALSPTREMSVNDKKALAVWDRSVRVVDGHYQLDVPFKQDPPALPDNKIMAERRLEMLRRRMQNNTEFGERYKAGIQDYLNDGYAEKVGDERGPKGLTWYIPHHAVFSAKKPDKLRIVFDCAAEYKGVSINESVHRGPDFTNRMIGVLLRFREKPVVIVADVQAMYHQVRVTPAHRDALRFLWFGDDGTIEIYRMCVHLFGGVWSASVSNYALKHTAEDHRDEFDANVIDAALTNFYVDDLLQAVDTEEEGIELAGQLRRLLLLRGFNLTKWMSNSRAILQSIPAEHHAKNVKEIDDLERGPLPKERALGVSWMADEDLLQISVGNKVPRFTKRGLISHYSTVYDPLGMVAPFILLARIMYRQECKINKGWDDELEPETEQKFRRWLGKLAEMKSISIPRCIAAPNIVDARKTELHHFCDASEEAFAAVSYLRVLQNDGTVHCAFIYGKAKLSPLKTETIPRLELMAAVLAAEHHLLLTNEMRVRFDAVYFWSDSMVVLAYLKSADGRFSKYISRRVTSILEASDPEQWLYVPTQVNPADVATRGAFELETWLNAPRFLFNDNNWPSPPVSYNVTGPTSDQRTKDEESDIKLGDTHEDSCDDRNQQTSDDERVDAESNTIMTPPATTDVPVRPPSDIMIHHFSSLYRLKRSVIWYSKLLKWLSDKTKTVDEITVAEMNKVEQNLIRYTQKSSFSAEYNTLTSGKQLPKKNRLYYLEPNIDCNGIMRVGGRLKYADVNPNAKNQILLPKDSHLTELIVRHAHVIKCLHSGIEHVLGVLRSEYWIPSARPLLRRIRRACAVCRRLGARAYKPKMADLPPERLAANQRPFTYVGIDCFGPILVKRGRCIIKRYGLIFTCMTIRAIHLEILPSLTTDAFINALRRFICRRGKPKRLVSDNGTNFVGAYRELGVALREWNNKQRLRRFLLQEMIEWSFNPPAASHMGGVWERLIRSVRRVFNAVIRNSSLDDFELQTVMCEIESVVNNRPITPVSSDKDDDEPLTPSHLLSLGSTGTAPPVLGARDDCYRRRWRYIQYLVDRFWRRWTKEYLPSIQHRRKWIADSPNAHVGDIVLIMDELTHRNQWPMGRIVRLHVGRDAKVRSCDVKTQKGHCTRPVTKLCLLESCDD